MSKKIGEKSIRIISALLLVLVFGAVIFQSGIGTALASASIPDASINAIPVTTQTESINYSYIVEEKGNLPSFPDYYNGNTLYGAEAEAAATAANLIAYYAKDYSGVIDFVPGSGSSKNYIFSSMTINNSAKQALINTLYGYMNLSASSHTISGLRKGMLSYVSDRGYMLGSYSILTNGAIVYSKLKSAIDDGYPVLVNVNGSNYVSISTSGTRQTITKNSFSGYHMCLVYGYSMVSYYNQNDELITTRLFLNVSFGIEESKFRQNRTLLADGLNVRSADTYIMWE